MPCPKPLSGRSRNLWLGQGKAEHHSALLLLEAPFPIYPPVWLAYLERVSLMEDEPHIYELGSGSFVLTEVPPEDEE